MKSKTSAVEQDMTNYELMLIFLPDLGEKGTEKEMEEITEMVSSLDGEILNTDIWGIKDLAYRIKKQNQGFYVVYNLSMPSLKMHELEKSLNLHTSVLRHLILRTPKNYFFKTLKEYEEEMKAEEIKKEKEKAEKEQEKEISRPRRTERPAKAPKKEEKAEEPVKETKKETKKGASKNKLEDFDAKLKSIIDDPDITL